jgi:hypothetical protein
MSTVYRNVDEAIKHSILLKGISDTGLTLQESSIINTLWWMRQGFPDLNFFVKRKATLAKMVAWAYSAEAIHEFETGSPAGERSLKLQAEVKEVFGSFADELIWPTPCRTFTPNDAPQPGRGGCRPSSILCASTN